MTFRAVSWILRWRAVDRWDLDGPPKRQQVAHPRAAPLSGSSARGMRRYHPRRHSCFGSREETRGDATMTSPSRP
jgi:hypothetical protein